MLKEKTNKNILEEMRNSPEAKKLMSLYEACLGNNENTPKTRAAITFAALEANLPEDDPKDAYYYSCGAMAFLEKEWSENVVMSMYPGKCYEYLGMTKEEVLNNKAFTNVYDALHNYTFLKDRE